MSASLLIVRNYEQQGKRKPSVVHLYDAMLTSGRYQPCLHTGNGEEVLKILMIKPYPREGFHGSVVEPRQ